jgi:hypothetical protein
VRPVSEGLNGYVVRPTTLIPALAVGNPAEAVYNNYAEADVDQDR